MKVDFRAVSVYTLRMMQKHLQSCEDGCDVRETLARIIDEETEYDRQISSIIQTDRESGIEA